VCAYPKVLEEVAAHHGKIRLPPDWGHNSARRFIRIVPPIPGLWNNFIHDSCACNELVGVTNRVLGKVPLPTEQGIKEIRHEMKLTARKCHPMEPWTYKQVLDTFHGHKRRIYEQAYAELQVSPLDHRDAYIKAFVKAEKMNPAAKINPDPRMIQARSPRYNLTIAKYLRPIEHYIYNLKGKSGLREVAKGLNQLERAELIKNKFAQFRNPVCFSIDASRWDKHVSYDVLQIEHDFYKRVVPNHPEFQRLLAWQLDNHIVTSNGLKYRAHGGRMSGDMNTGLGNCYLAVLMVRAAMRRLGIKKYEIVDDGDDCLVIVEEEDFSKISAELPRVFLEYGQELKVENIARDYRQVLFCQSRIVSNGIGDVMVRDWRKVMSGACCGTKRWNDPNMVRPMLGLVGTCELALCAGVPILQEFAKALIFNSHGKIANFEHLAGTGLDYRLKSEFGTVDQAKFLSKARDVTDDSRLDFEEAFGTPVWEQIEIEERLKRWTITDTTCADYASEYDHSWVDATHADNQIPEIY